MSGSRPERGRRAGPRHHHLDAEGEQLRSGRRQREDDEWLPPVPEPAEGEPGHDHHQSKDRSASEQRDRAHGRREPSGPMGRDEGQDRGVEYSELVVGDDVLQHSAEGDGAGSQCDQPSGEEHPGSSFRAEPPQQKFEGAAVAVSKPQESRVMPQVVKEATNLLRMPGHPPSGRADGCQNSGKDGQEQLTVPGVGPVARTRNAEIDSEGAVIRCLGRRRVAEAASGSGALREALGPGRRVATQQELRGPQRRCRPRRHQGSGLRRRPGRGP